MRNAIARRVLGLMVVSATALAAAGCAESTNENSIADDFPNRAIELRIGVSAGGGTDTHTRLLAPALAEALGQEVVVVNEPGGGGISLWSRIPTSEPDGYTLQLVSFPQVAGEYVQGNLPFDPSDSANIDILGNASFNPTAMAVGGDRSWDSIADMVEDARIAPGSVKVGITGAGSLDFLSLSAVAAAEDVEFTFVPFPGTSEGINAVLSGDIDVMGMGLVSAGSFVESGDLKLLAIGSNERVETFPDVATYAEQGFEILGGNPVAYFTVVAPPGLPDAIREILVDALEAATSNADYIENIEAIGGGVSYRTTSEMQDVVSAQVAQLQDLLQ